MPIPLSCDCGRSLRVKDELAGRRIKCPQCGAVLTVPRPQPAPDEDEIGLIPLEDAAQKAPLEGKESRPDPEEMVQTAPRPARRPAREKDDEDENEDEDERSTRESVRRREEREAERGREADRQQRRLVKRHREETRRDAVRYGEPGRPASHGWLGGTNAGIVGGLVMIVIAVIWFVAGAAVGVYFFYPPILAVIGVIAIIKGAVGR